MTHPDFARALYAELFDAEDSDDMENATREWSHASTTERSFAQVHLLWLIHERLSELGDRVASLADVVELLNRPPAPETFDEPDIIDAEEVEVEVLDD